MHPAPTFHWDARDELRAFITERAFATVCATVEGVLVVAQVPVLVDGERLLLHLSRGNPLSLALPQRVHVVVSGADAYVSPDWYSDPHQVPTWNYVSVEVAGILEATDDAGLLEILRKQSAAYEARIVGKAPWTVEKLPPAVLAAKLRGIIGATLAIESIRGTRKLSQNKGEADRAGVAAGLDAMERPEDREIARLVRALRS